MPTADNSYATRTKLAQARAMASFKLQNPTVRYLQGTQFEPSALLTQKLGEIPIVLQPSGIVEQGCCCTAPSGPITIYRDIETVTFVDPAWTQIIYWTPVENVTYTLTSDVSGVTFSEITNSNALMSVLEYPDSIPVTITGTNNCGSVSTSNDVPFPCFLAGSLVTLADGREIPIEDVKVWDVVVGAFGEHNEVLALHRPLLGKGKLIKINDEHITSAHHPHVASDKSFYCADPARVYSSTYGREHEVINMAGYAEVRTLHGLAAGRVQQLATGVVLKTIEGAREVKKIENLDFPFDTQLYNLVVGGSHTYHVEGYAVTGWPREDDFDYDNWTPK